VSKSDAWESDILRLLFLGTPIPNIADNAAIAPLTALYVSMHTADPTDGGNQATNEAAYGGYGRKPVARPGGWIVSGSAPTTVNPTTDLDFPPCTSAPGAPLTHFGVGAAAAGATKLFYSGPLTPTITMGVGVIPRLQAASTVTED
jgi:hypothetical protein